MSKVLKVGKMMSRAEMLPESINAEALTVQVVFATETPVRRYDWEIGAYMEILDCQPSSVRMERLNAGAPLLNDHDRYNGVSSVLGVVTDAKLEGKRGVATVKFSKREDVKPVFEDVKDGILRGVSNGYRVYEYILEKPATDNSLAVYRAIDWEPLEVSLAPIPADVNSQVRGEKPKEANDLIIKNFPQHRHMETPEEKQVREAEELRLRNLSIQNTEITDQQRKEVVQAEKLRVSQIRSIAKTCALDEEFVRTHEEGTTTVESFRALAISEMEKNTDTNKINGRAAVVEDEADKARKVLEATLVLRSGQGKVEDASLVKAANQFRSMTLLDFAKRSLDLMGVKHVGLSKLEIVSRAFSSTSDFPILLAGVNRQILLANYSAVSDTWRRLCTVGSVSDFREYKRLRMGTIGNLDTVLENEEYQNKKLTDADKESVQIKKKGNLINISREMIINDDLNAFARLPAMMGRAAARGIEKDLYDLFALNSGDGPTMGDGKALFHVDHGNIAGTPAAPTVTSVDAARILMAAQKDKDGNDFLDLRPAIALSGMSLGSTLRVLNQSQYDPNQSNKLQYPNVVAGLFKDVIDTNRLTGTPWYVFADPAEEPVFEVSFLDGVQEPYMESEPEFKTDGITWKVRHEYGVGAIGYKGAVKNAGA